MTLNDPALVATLARLHDAYERALAANDVPALNAFFWDSPHVVRYGVAEQLYGTDDLHAYRQGHTPRFTDRRILRREITVFGDHCATIMSEIELSIDGRPRANRQSQTWIKLPSLDWRIVAAHVSSPLPSPPDVEASPGAWEEYVTVLSTTLALPVEPDHLPGVVGNLTRAAALAAPLLAFSLPDQLEPAPVFNA